MAEPWGTIQVFGQEAPLVFRTQASFARWVKAEQETWSWLWSGTALATGLQDSRFQQYEAAWAAGVAAAEAGGKADEGEVYCWTGYLQDDDTERLLISGTPEGKEVLAIYEAGGILAGKWAYLFRVDNAPFRDAASIHDIRGVFLSAFPSMAGPERHREALQRERRSYREEVSKLQADAAEFQTTEAAQAADRLWRAHSLAQRLVRRTQQRWNELSHELIGESDAAIKSINDTRDVYEKQMALAAPVQYWEDKSKKHAVWEGIMLGVSLLFFAGALRAIYVVGSRAANYVLALKPDVDRAAVYVVVSGGLLAFITLTFWIGRIVVKLYLSEHHLRIDAAERAVMTKTYLAMIEQGSATETERAIVLSAIFRPTPDGIVKDDGPADVSLGGALSKLLTPK